MGAGEEEIQVEIDASSLVLLLQLIGVAPLRFVSAHPIVIHFLPSFVPFCIVGAERGVGWE